MSIKFGIQDIYGHELSDLELMQKLDKESGFFVGYAVVHFLSADKKSWCMFRYKEYNQRGDESSVQGQHHSTSHSDQHTK